MVDYGRLWSTMFFFPSPTAVRTRCSHRTDQRVPPLPPQLTECAATAPLSKPVQRTVARASRTLPQERPPRLTPLRCRSASLHTSTARLGQPPYWRRPQSEDELMGFNSCVPGQHKGTVDRPLTEEELARESTAGPHSIPGSQFPGRASCTASRAL